MLYWYAISLTHFQENENMPESNVQFLFHMLQLFLVEKSYVVLIFFNLKWVVESMLRQIYLKNKVKYFRRQGL